MTTPSARGAAHRPTPHRGWATVVFDLDGVVRHWLTTDFAAIEELHGLPVGAVFSEAFDPALLDQAITGTTPDEQWRHEFAHRLTHKHAVDGAAVVEAWTAAPATIDHEVLGLVRSVRRRGRCVVLTNATSRLRSDLYAVGLTDEFDHIFSSAELGVAKPDVRAFHLVLEQLDVGRSDVLFVDDSAANVAAAQQVGLRAHHLTSAVGLRRFLARHSIPVAMSGSLGHDASDTQEQT